MKIRAGFVSNSSSSSFCLLGTSVSSFDFDNNDMEDKLKELDFEYGIENFYEEVIIGLSPDEIGNNETGAEFKERVKKLLKEELDIDDEPDYFIDGGHD